MSMYDMGVINVCVWYGCDKWMCMIWVW